MYRNILRFFIRSRISRKELTAMSSRNSIRPAPTKVNPNILLRDNNINIELSTNLRTDFFATIRVK